jgi:hypothetical protein
MREALTGMGQAADTEARVEALTSGADPVVVAVFEEFDRSIERGGDRYVRRSRTKAAARLVDLDHSHGGAAGQAAPLCGQPTRAGSCTFRAGHAGGCACGP